MLKYLVVLLDDKAPSYCHYEVRKTESSLMPFDMLQAAIVFCLKHNLTPQFVLPLGALPKEYKEVIAEYESCVYASSDIEDKLMFEQSDMIVLDGLDKGESFKVQEGQTYILRISKSELLDNGNRFVLLLNRLNHINVVITDIDQFSDADFELYKSLLSICKEEIKNLWLRGHNVQCNLITDRLLLAEMNNCEAGMTHVTLAPDGGFYLCPGFYQSCDESEAYQMGNIFSGLNLKNPQLLRLDYAPICKNCDAYQCKRCLWLNQKTTLEVNTPSREQCVMAHIERNAARELLGDVKPLVHLFDDVEIPANESLDPFEIITA